MKPLCLLLMAALMSSCATLNDSLELGAGMGAVSGAAAAYAGRVGTGPGVSFTNVAVGAGIGMGVGLLASYLVHRSVESDRQSQQNDQTEMHFGDLPPSPFIVPKMKIKKGVR